MVKGMLAYLKDFFCKMHHQQGKVCLDLRCLCFVQAGEAFKMLELLQTCFEHGKYYIVCLTFFNLFNQHTDSAAANVSTFRPRLLLAAARSLRSLT